MQPDLRPMLATLTDKPFDDPDWMFETKWDGFRAIAVAEPGHASLYSRNAHRHLAQISVDLSSRSPRSSKRPCSTASLWRSIAQGRSRFQLLQNAEREATRLLYCVFDLLYLDGKDLRALAAARAQGGAEAVLPKSPLLLYSAHVVGKGLKAFERPSARRKRASWPSSPAAATTPASARATG